MGDILRGVAGKKKVSAKLSACQDEAKQQGVSVIGLDDKKCWSGPDAENTYDMYGNSGQCKTTKSGDSMGYYASESIFVYKKNNNGKFLSENR